MLVVKRLASCFAVLGDYWRPMVVASPNHQLVKALRILGEFAWHRNDADDKAFLVCKGQLVVQTETERHHLGEGDLIMVPRGMRHRIVAINECHALLFETDARTAGVGHAFEDVYSTPYTAL